MKKLTAFLLLACCIAPAILTTGCSKEETGPDISTQEIDKKLSGLPAAPDMPTGPKKGVK